MPICFEEKHKALEEHRQSIKKAELLVCFVDNNVSQLGLLSATRKNTACQESDEEAWGVVMGRPRVHGGLIQHTSSERRNTTHTSIFWQICKHIEQHANLLGANLSCECKLGPFQEKEKPKDADLGKPEQIACNFFFFKMFKQQTSTSGAFKDVEKLPV